MALRARTGDVWEVLGLYREPDHPMFSLSEMRFVRDTSATLAHSACRGLLVWKANDPEGSHSPGMVVLRVDWSVNHKLVRSLAAVLLLGLLGCQANRLILRNFASQNDDGNRHRRRDPHGPASIEILIARIHAEE